MKKLILAACGLLLLVGAIQPADADRATADEAILKAARQGTDAEALLAYFRGRTLSDVDTGKIQGLIRQLGDESFEVRERASAMLVALGAQTEPFLQDAMRDPDIEIVRRAEECLKLLKGGGSSEVDAAAVRLLAMRRPAGAVEALLGYSPFAATDQISEEVRTALGKLAVQDGKPHPALVTALQDKSFMRRAAAGVALCQFTDPELRPPVRKLLRDPEATVRLHVGVALAKAKEREAIPVLIELLAELRPSQAWPVEDLLCRLADEQAPLISQGTSDTSRRTCRDAWVAWWAKAGAQADLGTLTAPAKERGYTLLVFLDAGKVVEVDSKNKARWQFEGTVLPLDVELLPGLRVLVAEHNANLVSERNRQGEVIWEKKLLSGPLVAQRLPNGNTFICTNSQLLEVNRDGKEVWVYSRPDGEGFRKAVKLPNGDFAVVTTAQRYIRMNAAGQEIANFEADVHTNGGRLDVQPNGNVLIPQMKSGKVTEYDSQGKTVWEAELEDPIAAVRLPNGNTLITTYSQHRAMELDKNKKVVWEYLGDSRLTRAFRR